MREGSSHQSAAMRGQRAWSTTGNRIPPSISTRRSDGFWHERILLVAVIRKSPIKRSPATGCGVAAAAALGWPAVVRYMERGGAALARSRDVQYGPFNTYIPIRSTTIGKSRVAKDPIAMHTSWRSNSDIASVTSIGYPRMKASGESSTTKHRLLHSSGPHPIPPPKGPKTNQYNQDLGLIHSTNGNHLESPNEGSSIDHQVTIHLYAQNITMFPTNETCFKKLATMNLEGISAKGEQDTTATANSLPAATTPDVTNALNQLRASIDQIRERDDDGAKTKDTLLLHLSNFENQVIARLDAQDRVLGALRKASNDQRNLLSLELQSSHKQLGAQIVTTGLDVVEVRRVVKETHQELTAKINSLDEQVAATRNYLLEFSAQAQQTLNIITSQLSELVAYINRGGDNKKGESSSRGPQSQSQPPPSDVQNLESGQSISLEEAAERIREADRRQAEAERERERQRRIRRLSGSSKIRRY
ncbi:hypothetical protein F511_22756 [Dorcoceras hygrometricum]|uniref:Uncharacterized protein n=1 Tax=Dorcoceras hygrometricum TaxID=472368 RepID=A0A2Z7DDS9_9LAMI|nr:hypothetical protein F511_22756 [Dorcoceras hygrometricum]